MIQPKTAQVVIENWKAGMDCRAGYYAINPASFKEMVNCILTQVGNVQMRPPMLSAGLLDSDTQGLVELDGVFYTFAPKGAVVSNTATVTTVYFDVPDHCSAGWTLVASGIFNNYVYAVIKHAYPCASVPYRTFLHIFDGMADQPTYVSDPYTPTDWSEGGFPVHSYGTLSGRKVGTYDNYTPVTESCVSKLHLSRSDYNVGFSGIARARVWNSRTAADIAKVGAMYYTIVPDSGTISLVIPESKTELQDITKFAFYILEKLNMTTGTWTPVVEKLSAPASGEYILNSTTPAWASSARAQISCSGLTSGTIVRFRCGIQAEVEVLTGGTVNPQPETFYTDGTTNKWQTTVPYKFKANYGVTIDGASISTSAYSWTDVSGSARLDFVSQAPTTVGNRQHVLTVAKAFGGAGYTAGDILTVQGTTGTAPTIRVLSVLAGVIQTIELATFGDCSAYPANPVTVLGGTGAGATFNLTWGSLTVITLSYTLSSSVYHPLETYINGTSVNKTIYDGNLYGYGAGTTLILFDALYTSTSVMVCSLIPGGELTAPNKRLVSVALTTSASISASTVRFEGASQDVNAVAVPGNGTWYIGVGVSGVTTYTDYASPTWTGLDKYHLRVLTVTTVAGGVITASSAFQYGNEALTDWYVARNAYNLSYWQGSGEASYLNTAAQNVQGGPVTSMLSIKNRLAVFHQTATELWSMDADQNNIAFIDRHPLGTTDPAVLFYNNPMINSQRGFRLFQLGGLNFQSLDDVNIGEPVQHLGSVSLQAACWWPWNGMYVGFVTISGTEKYAVAAGLPEDSIFHQTSFSCFVTLSYSKESETVGWSFHPVTGLTSIDGKWLHPIGSKVYFRSGTNFYYLDAEATRGTDVTGTYESVAMTHYHDMGTVNRGKRFMHIRVIQDGACTMSFNPTPVKADVTTGAIPVPGLTSGHQIVPIQLTGDAMSIRFTSSDPDWELQALQYSYALLGR